MPMTAPARRAAIFAAASTALALTIMAAPTAAQEVPVEAATVTELARFTDTHTGRPSLSPDGRWLVFGIAERPEAQNLWIMPAAGGERVRLTSGAYWDEDPVWSPDGRLLVFGSNRSSRSNPSEFYLMRMAMDPATGRATGAPRQLSVEPVQLEPAAVSPDGRSVVYVTAELPRELRVIPVEGGVALTLAERPRNIFNPGWTPDGGEVVFTSWAPEQRHEVWRVPAGGGEARRVHVVTERFVRPLGTAGMVMHEVDRAGVQSRVLEVADPAGRVHRRLEVDARLEPVHFTPDGAAILATVPHVDAPIRLVSTAGGTPRDVTPGTAYDWPIGWTTDGAVLATTVLPSGRGAVVVVEPDGTRRRAIELPDDAVGGAASTLTGETIMYWLRPTDGPDSYTLVMQRVSDGRRFQLLRGPRVRAGLNGRGGVYDADGADLLFARREAGMLHYYAASPDGDVRLLRSMEDRRHDQAPLAVHGERVALVERHGAELHVRVADDARAPFRTVARIPDPGDDPRLDIAWDHDGRRLAVPFYAGADDDRYAVAFIDVPAGDGTARPVIVDTGGLWGYEARWLPDGSGITLLVQRTGGVQMDVILVPARAGARPVVLTEGETATMWGQLVSPDGRWVAYPAEVPRGSAIVRVELGPMP